VSGVWFPGREKEPVRLQQSEFATRTWGGVGDENSNRNKVAGNCECGNEPSDSIKCGEFLN
jgi:hypothetical protein